MLMSRLQNKTRIVHEKGMEMRRMGAKNDMRGGGTIVFIRELRKNVSAFNGTNEFNPRKRYAVNVMRDRATNGQVGKCATKG